MTLQRHFKAIVRARMRATGETYTTARRAVAAELASVRIEPLATIEAHERHCIAVRFTPDGRFLLSGGFGGQARLWSTDGWTRDGELVGHEASVNAFAVDPEGRRVVTVSSDRTVRVWDLATRTQRASLAHGGKPATSADLLPGGETAVTGGLDGRVRLWNLADGSAGPDARVAGRVASVAAHPATGRIAVATATAAVELLHPDASPAGSIGVGGPAMQARWARDGSFLAVTTLDGRVELWDADERELLRAVTLGAGSMHPVAVSPDSTLLAAGWDRHVAVWRADAPDGKDGAARVDGLPKGVYTLDFSPDGRLLAQGGADGRVRIWRVRS